MDQATLVRDLAHLEERVAGDTDILLHVSQIRELAASGYYHLKAGDIENPVTGARYPVYSRRRKDEG